jgi:hypothetical protein
MDYFIEFNKMDDESKANIQCIFDFIDREIDKNIKELKSGDPYDFWGEIFYEMVENELSFIDPGILKNFKFNIEDFLYDYFIKALEIKSKKPANEPTQSITT